MAITPIPGLHESLRDIAGSRGLHAFAMGHPTAGMLTTPAPATGTKLLENGRMYAIPFYQSLRAPRAIAGLRVSVQAAGTVGALCRVGLYRHRYDVSIPDALVVDAGTIDITSTGIKFQAAVGVTSEGIYWLVAVGQGAPATHATLHAAAGWNPYTAFLVGDPGAADMVGLQSLAATHTGALPAVFGSASSIVGPLPRVILQ